MSRILYFDCFSGASGDMLLGAFLDAGLPLEELRQALGSLAIAGSAVSARRVLRAGVSATKFLVAGAEASTPSSISEGHGHDHSHEHHHPQGPADHHHGDWSHHGTHTGHRSLAEIYELIDQSALTPSGKTRAQELFRRLGEVEAGIHQISLDRIHLHEVGALDSIIDIVGVVFAMEWFAADRIVSSPLNVGGGMVRSAHGVFPVPAPATLQLLQGLPVYSSGAPAELVTPTGALLISAYADSYGPLPAMTVERTGYGAGDRDLPDTPNVLRILVGTAQGDAAAERVVVLECEIDDMDPQIFGPLMDRLYAAGALDVFFTSVQMKKNRPGTLLTIVARPDERQALSALVFRESTSLGVRYQEVARERLARESVAIETPLGSIRFKVARLGSDIVNAAPEFEDCARVSTERGVPIKEVLAVATKAYLDARAVLPSKAGSGRN